jgi:hypothetical protein
VLGVLAHGGGNIVERGLGEPSGEAAGGTIRVGGCAGGFAGRVFSMNCHLISPFSKQIKNLCLVAQVLAKLRLRSPSGIALGKLPA